MKEKFKKMLTKFVPRVNPVPGLIRILKKKWIFYPLSFCSLSILIIFFVIRSSGDSSFTKKLENTLVNDVTQLNPVYVEQVIRATSIEQIVEALRSTTGKVSIGGGRFSMGGQVASENSLHLDMRAFDKVVAFDAAKKEITVEPGITWRKIQEYIDPHKLSIRIMQTYSNFTVGGSLSVNVHGRYMGEGALVMAVKSLKLVTARGELIIASPEQNSDVFYGVIGGYGGLGVIVEATLSLADNDKVERKVKMMKTSEYKDHFFKNIRENKEVIFHNADIYPPAYESVRDVSWYRTEKELTNTERLIPEDRTYPLQPYLVDFVAGTSLGKWIRERLFDPLYYSSERIVWRNWEASYDVKELEPRSREKYTYVLREYFIPVERFDEFYPQMAKIFNDYDVNVINVSIRHAKKDPGTLLAWAKEEVFAFVVYYRQGVSKEEQAQVDLWSEKLVALAIANGGSYYLPYQHQASVEQFSQAYPRASEYFSLKERLDSENRFTNKLWQKYYPKNQDTLTVKSRELKQYFRPEEQTFLTLPEWYLVFNPKEYADFLSKGSNPSDFPFYASIDEYWTLYDRVLKLTEGLYPYNSEYVTMLNVIGVSTTIEYLLKSLYENTFGRFTYWTASSQTQEDLIISWAHKAYSDLIYDKAWYEFDFLKWVKLIWKEPKLFEKNFIRKTERKLFFSVEFLVKAIYAKLIEFGAKTAYEESEGLIYMKVKAPDLGKLLEIEGVKAYASEGDRHLLSVPRWGAFSKIVPQLSAREVDFLDISGNNEILLTVLTEKTQEFKGSFAQLLFESRVVSDPNLKRLALLINVNKLKEALNGLDAQGLVFEHLFDY